MKSKSKSVFTALIICILAAVFFCSTVNVLAEDGEIGDCLPKGASEVQGTAISGMLKPGSDWIDCKEAGIKYSQVTDITFSDSTIPAEYSASWDVSAKGDGSVTAYLTGTEVTIVGNGSGKIIANPDCTSMFAFSSLNCINNLHLLDTSSVTDMTCMFDGCESLTSIDLSGFDTSSVTNMSYMFVECNNLASLDLSGFDTSSVTDMNTMFQECINLTGLDLSSFDTSSVTDMSAMFADCKSLANLDLSSFDTSSVTDMNAMFCDCESLASLDLSSFDTSSVTNMSYMFSGCESLTSIDLSGFDTSSVTNMGGMFNVCKSLASLDLSGFDTSSVTDLCGMFFYCESLISLDLSVFDTSSVTNMYCMFYDCKSLANLDLSSFDTSSVTSMGYMFVECSNLASLDLSGFDTSSVADMEGMFIDCESLVNLDLSSFDTSSVTSTYYMFLRCKSLVNLDLSSFDMSSVTNMGGMFCDCESLISLDLSGFDTSSVIWMYEMFYGCESLISLDLSSFDTSSVKNMQFMFCNCESLATIYVGDSFSTEAVRYYDPIFTECYSLTGGNGNRFDTAITSDITMARADSHETPGLFTYKGPDQCTISYDLNYPGAQGMSFTQQVKQGEKITLGGSDGQAWLPEKRGCRFLGWSASRDTGKILQSGSALQAAGSSMTFYARWDRVDYFTDVFRTDWYYDDVYFMYDRELMFGMGNRPIFAPLETLTREQLAVMLYRLEIYPDTEYSYVFPDVPDDTWYTAPIIWAYRNGIITGYQSGYFGVGDNITREQLAVMLYRYAANYKHLDVSQKADISGFTDAASVSSWAYDAISWAVGKGIITGKDSGTRIDPQGNTARCECAAMFHRFMNKYGL